MSWVDILEKNDRLSVWFSGQQGTEEGRAHAQDELVSFKHFGAASQQHVREHFCGAELLQDAEEAVVMIVPF